MPDRVSFYCHTCRSRLKASVRYVGRSCACPKCGDRVVVPALVPTEEAPLLVMDDGHRTTHRQARYRSLWESMYNSIE